MVQGPEDKVAIVMHRLAEQSSRQDMGKIQMDLLHAPQIVVSSRECDDEPERYGNDHAYASDAETKSWQNTIDVCHWLVGPMPVQFLDVVVPGREVCIRGGRHVDAIPRTHTRCHGTWERYLPCPAPIEMTGLQIPRGG